MSGVFITVEGPEGAGKTTLIEALEPILKQQLNCELLLTREPGGNEIAERIRDIILDPAMTKMDAKTEALLYAAARRQHLVDNILPVLHRDGVVLCDRFVDSSIAYQGVARGIGTEGIRDINAFATDNQYPNLTLYLDIDVVKGLERIKQHRSEDINRLDMEDISFHESVRKGYLDLCRQYPDRIIVLDALASTEILVEETLKILHKKFDQYFRKEEKV